MTEETAGTRTLLGDQRKGVIALAIPIGVALFFQQLNNIVDSLWVAGLGGSAMSALGIVYPIYTILIGIGNGLGIGVGAAIARNIGQRNHADANKSAAQGVFITAVVSIILTPILLLTAEYTMVLMGAGDTVGDCLDYAYPIYLSSFFVILSGVMSGMLRGEGAAKRSMAIQVIGALVNIVLDPVFIYVLDMGVAGAAWATALCQTLSFFVLLSHYMRGKGSIAMQPSWISRSAAVYVSLVKNGIPSLTRNVLGAVAASVLNLMAGSFGDAGVAGMSIVGRVMMITAAALIGIGQGFQPVLGYNWGAGKRTRVRAIEKYCIAAAAIISLTAAAVVHTIPDTIASLYVDRSLPALITATTGALSLFSFAFVTRWIAFVTQSFMLAIEKPRYAAAISISTALIFPMLLLLILSPLGLDGIWLNFAGTNALAAILAIAILIRERKNLMREDD